MSSHRRHSFFLRELECEVASNEVGMVALYVLKITDHYKGIHPQAQLHTYALG